MNGKPLISIIIPVYNVEKYLNRCLDSVISQSYDNLEIILVNDGSNDCSKSICENYAKKDSRIVFINKSNGGLSDARNAGLDIAKGDLIGFIDSDDYIEQDCYETMLSRMISTNADLVICNYQYVDELGNVILRDESISSDEVLSKTEGMKRLTVENSGYYITAWNKLYTKYLLEDIRFPVGRIHEDNFVVHKIINKCEKIAILTEKKFYYSQRQGSISASNINFTKHFDNIYALCARVEFLQAEGYNDLISANVKQLVDTFIEYRRFYLFHSKKDIYGIRVNKDVRKKIINILNANKNIVSKQERNIIRMPEWYIFKQIVFK